MTVEVQRYGGKVTQRFSFLLTIHVLFMLSLLPGCGPQMRPYGVPYGGSLVGEAAGKQASFTAPREGTVWVAGPGKPGQERYIVYSGLVKAGQVVTVDPQSRAVTVNGEKQKAEIVGGGESYYQVWFQATPEN